MAANVISDFRNEILKANILNMEQRILSVEEQPIGMDKIGLDVKANDNPQDVLSDEGKGYYVDWAKVFFYLITGASEPAHAGVVDGDKKREPTDHRSKHMPHVIVAFRDATFDKLLVHGLTLVYLVSTPNALG